MNVKERKLMVLFPGRRYSTDKPLLYYAGMIFASRGYDVIRLSYDDLILAEPDADIPTLINKAMPMVEKKLSDVNFDAYSDIVFISKSMGCALAGEYEKKYKLKVRQLYLTPVAESLKYMSRGRCMVVAGKEDYILTSKRLRIYCVEQDIPLKQFEDVGHSLEHKTDINITLAILMVMIRLYKEF